MAAVLKKAVEPKYAPAVHACDHDWQVARLTELLLMGHSWRQVQSFMMLSKSEFDRLLAEAVDRVQAEQRLHH